MEERGRVELKRPKRSGEPVSLVLCDLDHFTNIKDKYGAEAVAERMRAAIAATKLAGVSEGVTIILGVTTSEHLDDPAMEYDLLIREADQRL